MQLKHCLQVLAQESTLCGLFVGCTWFMYSLIPWGRFCPQEPCLGVLTQVGILCGLCCRLCMVYVQLACSLNTVPKYLFKYVLFGLHCRLYMFLVQLLIPWGQFCPQEPRLRALTQVRILCGVYCRLYMVYVQLACSLNTPTCGL